ncbi:AIPR family protein [Nocardia sp. NPDC004151]|uniref:AIPR family protein n=1 Tax=Nocardia sp. NPDC004151 TaxID=3364304 RepID=UPI00369416BE
MYNEAVLVNRILEAAQDARAEPLPDDVAFELFAAQSVLREFDLSDEEVEVGRIGGGKDGGIDGFYVFLDGALLDEDSDVFADDFKASNVRKHAEMDVWVIQAKRESSFTETAFDKLQSSLGRLFDLTQDDEQLKVLYSKELISRVRIFTDAWMKLGIRSPRITVHVDYVTKGNTTDVGKAVDHKRGELETFIESRVKGSASIARLIGATELYDLASTEPEYDLQLRVAHYVPRGTAYSGLVRLSDYYEFLSDDRKRLRTNLFDWNVRDYQGEVMVNRAIQATLESDQDEDFWWFNNGVTILCSSVSISGESTFTLAGVQIVNGMQTSHEIHAAIGKSNPDAERWKRRSVSVRIIQAQDEEVRDKIIRATNSQTKVHDASLHATEKIHRQIEAYFKGHGWYYDRRKNFYKNTGKAADRIIGIPALGQAVMAIGLSRPDDARARPTTLLNNAKDYADLFNEQIALDVYLWAAAVQRRVDTLMLAGADRFVRANLRFHVSCFIVTRTFGRRIFSPKQLATLAANPVDFSEGYVSTVTELLQDLAVKIGEENEWTLDRVAKSKPFVEDVIRAALGANDEMTSIAPALDLGDETGS